MDAFMDPRAGDHLTLNPAVTDAWATIRTIYQTARTLRRYNIINGTGRADHYEWEGDSTHHEQRGGELLTASIRDNLTDDNLTWFVMALQHGLTPVLLTHTDTTATKVAA